MRLDVLTMDQCERVRLWRNDCLETLRTPYPLTKEQQEEFYRTRVCNPDSSHRYYAVLAKRSELSDKPDFPDTKEFIGMAGLTYIQRENRIAEISLILDPVMRGKGLGEKAVDLLLEEAFDRLGLKTVFGECYLCNQNGYHFWVEIAKKYHTGGYVGHPGAILPNRKFWAGKFWDSYYFSIDGDDWRKVHGTS